MELRRYLSPKVLMKVIFMCLIMSVKRGKKMVRNTWKQMIPFIIVTVCALYYYFLSQALLHEVSKWSNIVTLRFVDRKLEESLKIDKGMGCPIPVLDPFSEEMTRFDKVLPKVVCDRNKSRDWVKCYHSQCKVVEEIKAVCKDIICSFNYILHVSDQEYNIGPPLDITGDEVFELTESDHVKVKCHGYNVTTGKQMQWMGNTLGLRSSVKPMKSPPGRERSYNVLVFGYDSAARNGFIRRMPLSWKVLTEELGATVMEGYNIVGSGTPAAMFPILTGKAELELPDVTKKTNKNLTMDAFPFIFSKLKANGYRTAYLEDMPQIGTFQYRFYGWHNQPADHYVRSLLVEDGNECKRQNPQMKAWEISYCIGDTPQYKMMINITQQFMELGGKRFAFTFICGMSHDDFNLIQSADEDTAAFLRSYRRYAEDTLLVILGDHGPRFSPSRNTMQGKIEERLPLLAMVLPAALARSRPAAAAALRANARALTTPHDLHATILDVLGMTRHWNPHRVQGADLPRALTMLQPIPRNRSCSEAGIELHWCACAFWDKVSSADPLYERAAVALINFINQLLTDVGSLCATRTLLSIEWMVRLRGRSHSVYDGRSDHTKTQSADQIFQIKIVSGPGRGLYEATMLYGARGDYFLVDPKDISRTSAYLTEPHCIILTHPHLNDFCYCRKPPPYY